MIEANINKLADKIFFIEIAPKEKCEICNGETGEEVEAQGCCHTCLKAIANEID